MDSNWAKACLALALAVAPAVAQAAGTNAGRGATGADAFDRSRFDLAASTAPGGMATPAWRVREKSPFSLRGLTATGVQFGTGLPETVSGPSWSYRSSRRGPVVELGALGGGTIEDVPFLAHLALAWQF